MEQQKHVVAEIDTLLELLEHTPEANALKAMQGMDRLQQLLEIPPAGCEDQTSLAKQEDVQ